MIQRVQSIYLLLVTILMSFLLIRSYAELTLADGQILTFRSHAILISSGNDITSVYKSTIAIISLALITAILSFINIFLYGRRIIQMRICLINSILLVLLLALMFVYYSYTKSSLTVTHHTFKISAIFPLLALVFNLMAYRTIHHDELLVNSYKRIR